MNKNTLRRIFNVIDSDENGFMEEHEFKSLMFSEEANDIYIKYMNSEQFLKEKNKEL